MTKSKNEIIITKEQHETLLGIILGEGHLELAENKKSARLKIEQSQEKRVYVEHFCHFFLIKFHQQEVKKVVLIKKINEIT